MFRSCTGCFHVVLHFIMYLTCTTTSMPVMRDCWYEYDLNLNLMQPESVHVFFFILLVTDVKIICIILSEFRCHHLQTRVQSLLCIFSLILLDTFYFGPTGSVGWNLWHHWFNVNQLFTSICTYQQKATWSNFTLLTRVITQKWFWK